jgi:hypothetical protein
MSERCVGKAVCMLVGNAVVFGSTWYYWATGEHRFFPIPPQDTPFWRACIQQPWFPVALLLMGLGLGAIIWHGIREHLDDL